MEIRHLMHFAAVVETGNLSKAAERVFISQPALTRSIKNLEESLGAVLFERRPRGVFPTPGGEALYRYARLVLNECSRAKAEVNAVQSGAKGQIAIGMAAMFAEHIVDRAVIRMCASGLDVAMTVREGFIEEMVEAIRDGRLDLIFSNLSAESLPDDLTVEPLYDLRAYVYVAAGHALAGSKQVSKEELLRERWVIVDQPHMNDFLNRYFSTDGLPLPISVVRTNSLNLMTSLLASGKFVGILPQHLARLRAKRGTFRRVDTPDCPVVRKAALITRATAPARPILSGFIDELRRACREAQAMR